MNIHLSLYAAEIASRLPACTVVTVMVEAINNALMAVYDYNSVTATMV